MSFTIVGLGEVLWDLLPSGKQMGGAPASFAYHAQQLGLGAVESIVVSAIGDDRWGSEISSRLKTLSLTDAYVAVDKHHPTGTVQVTIPEEGEHSFEIRENVAWDHIPDTPALRALAKTVDAVCFGSLAQRSQTSRNTIRLFLQHIPSEAWCIFDINLRQAFFSQEIIESSLDRANVLKMNDEDDLSVLSGLFSLKGSEEDRVEALANRYHLRYVVLTKGEHGSILYSREHGKALYHSGFAVDEPKADTVGAGDAFTASIAVGLLKRFDFDYLHDCANRAAAFVCSQSGATPPLPDEIKRLFRT